MKYSDHLEDCLTYPKLHDISWKKYKKIISESY